MLLGGTNFPRILPTFERMLGPAVNEAQLAEIGPKSFSSQGDTRLPLQVRRQSPRRPHAEQVSKGSRTSIDCILEQSQILRRDRGRSSGPRLVLQGLHPCADPAPFPVGDRVQADTQDFGNLLAALALRQHQQTGCSRPDPGRRGRSLDSPKTSHLRSGDFDRYGCRHVELPPSSSPEGSLA